MKNFNFKLGVCAAVLALGIAVIIGTADRGLPTEDSATEISTVEATRIEAPNPIEESDTAELTKDEYMNLGEYKLTAYCACEKCCGIWATNRPTDKDGNPIIYTASMAEAKQGVTVSADTDILPFGTVIAINGHEYTVQDRGGAIEGRHIDIFFDSHEEAKEFGVQYAEVLLKIEATAK